MVFNLPVMRPVRKAERIHEIKGRRKEKSENEQAKKKFGKVSKAFLLKFLGCLAYSNLSWLSHAQMTQPTSSQHISQMLTSKRCQRRQWCRHLLLTI